MEATGDTNFWFLRDLDGSHKKKSPPLSGRALIRFTRRCTTVALAVLGRADNLGDPRCRFARCRRSSLCSPRRPFTGPFERPAQIAMKATAIKRGW